MALISNNSSDVNNNTESLDFDIDDMMFMHYLGTVIVPILFSIIILVGTFGNLMVVIVILTNKKLKNLTSILLFNLAVADILFLLTCVPFQTYKFAATEFMFGDVACKIAQYSLYVTGYVTVYTLVAIAILRFLTVVKSHATLRYRTQRNAVITCLLIWISILVFNIPTLFAHKLTIIRGENVSISYCAVVPNAIQPVFLSFFIAGYVIPLLLVTYLYLLIIVHLKKHQLPQNKSTDSGRGQQRTSHALKVIIIVVLVFCISWLPMHVHILVALYGNSPGGHFYLLLRVLWHCMAYGNSLANPVIYALVSSEFRESFKKLLYPKCCKTHHRSCSSHVTTSTCVEELGQSTIKQQEEMKPLNENGNEIQAQTTYNT